MAYNLCVSNILLLLISQILSMALITLLFAILGILSPANRGALATSTVVFFMLMGIVSGHVAMEVYKSFRGKQFQRLAAYTALIFPGCVFAVFFLLNIFLYEQHSAGFVPMSTMAAVVLMWFGMSVPLVVLGSYLGYRNPAKEPPVSTLCIPRQIPEQVRQ